MIIAIILATISLIVVGKIIYHKSKEYSHWGRIGDGMAWFGYFFLIMAIITGIILGGVVSGLNVLDERIDMYQEENAKIEESIAMLVENYQQYETGVFDDAKVKSNSAMTLVSMYPELKSDSLVQAQIDIYVANNQMIRDLRNEKITAKVIRWWLYFGN